MKAIPRTVNNYINTLKRLMSIVPEDLKGHRRLSEEQQKMLGVIRADLENAVGEYDSILMREELENHA